MHILKGDQKMGDALKGQMVIPDHRYHEFILNTVHCDMIRDYLLKEVTENETKDDVIRYVLRILGSDRSGRTD